MNKNLRLSQKPKYLRSSLAKGVKSAPEWINPTGGNYGAGVIRGAAIITRGEALGHGFWIDVQMLSQVEQAINGTAKGSKSRFTHPGLSGDGLAKFLGRATTGKLDGDVTRGDIHFAKTARRSPDGDLAGYVLARAQEDPDSFGISISFLMDWNAVEKHALEHGAFWDEDELGPFLNFSKFKSDDPLNTQKLPHARLAELRAVDVVDDPAANPDGLFHRHQELAQEAESYASYVLGLTHERPQTTQLGVDPDRALGFVQRFLDRHGLSIISKPTEKDMAQNDTPVDTPEQAVETPTVETPTAETPPAAESPVEQSSSTATEGLSEGQKFLNAFGQQGGVWYAQGKSFAEAQVLFNEGLRAENEKLTKQLAETQAQLKALAGQAEPASFSTDESSGSINPQAAQSLGNGGLAKFASGLEFSK